ncbi:MaoC/PaaZ C-terminal domain-containing protein [Actinomadura madurae]|uniref:MaoC/PaaZ C-terminal domain-containing protein n=1 Tax=Actinomadura madurae TaxID=1993 RepID=UPI00202682DC|nr:MaoC/PaaZ C-terminal domain-containing protein [Actinomadura madurae]MCP9950061.1 enoyl-CoA hydratase [Actinomadura madurae]MCP9966824.1 enoyl-CoA hydratase [Actinomadura madurae]MCP9979309.1 enoyl-CoA hydratase [Actinomadura madurae]MCQ0009165.1 enoyl-CoA hydratase [Actinomadura madurae]URN06325.1 enoyl-CoA hydratase [Actinomadura madurae]
MTESEWRGRELGTRTVAYDDTQPMLYALAVGARATDLDLVFEERLRVLPTFALTLGQWAPDALGTAGAFDVRTTIHGTQRLRVLKPLPRSGAVETTARVADVWDKGSAAVFDLTVESEYFEATWSLFAPDRGGFGGERGPSAPRRPEKAPDGAATIRTSPNQAALYRLLGDRHHLHIDPEAAKTAGMPRPVMHGLCTLGAVTLPLAESLGVHPAELRELEGRFAAPVFPGDELQLETWQDGGGVLFEAAVDGTTVLSAGRARFA